MVCVSCCSKRRSWTGACRQLGTVSPWNRAIGSVSHLCSSQISICLYRLRCRPSCLCQSSSAARHTPPLPGKHRLHYSPGARSVTRCVDGYPFQVGWQLIMLHFCMVKLLSGRSEMHGGHADVHSSCNSTLLLQFSVHAVAYVELQAGLRRIDVDDSSSPLAAGWSTPVVAVSAPAMAHTSE